MKAMKNAMTANAADSSEREQDRGCPLIKER